MNSIASELTSICQVLLDLLPAGPNQVVCAMSGVNGIPEEYPDVLQNVLAHVKRTCPDMDDRIVEQFLRVNDHSTSLDGILGAIAGIRLLDTEAFRSIAHSDNFCDDNKSPTGSNGLLELSYPAMNINRNWSLIYVIHSHGMLASSGEFYAFHRVDRKWELASKFIWWET
ncbi:MULTISPECIES: hypothetical protein [Pirellulaceae]|nr:MULTISPECIES: hypothetical protein [Pirellulaceae]